MFVVNIMEEFVLCMVKNSNTRVMHTLSKETKKMLGEIADTFGMSESAAINMLIVVFHNERMKR